MEKHPTIADGWQQIQRTALDMVADERQRQLDEKGYSYDHDDQHAGEELAAAAAFYLIPASIDQDVCTCTADYGLETQSLLSLIGASAFPDLSRDDLDVGLQTAPEMDSRIGNLIRGLALGLAELERWMRMRELCDQAEED